MSGWYARVRCVLRCDASLYEEIGRDTSECSLVEKITNISQPFCSLFRSPTLGVEHAFYKKASSNGTDAGGGGGGRGGSRRTRGSRAESESRRVIIVGNRP